MKKNTLAQIAGVAGGVTAVGAAVYAYSHRNEPRKKVTPRQARKIGEELGIDWTRFAPEEFRRGMEVELEHGLRNPMTDVTGDNLLLTGKIALAQLEEFPDYYTRLTRMEEEAKAYWSSVEASAVPVEAEVPS
jgi:Protein of unknown function (DUF5661)